MRAYKDWSPTSFDRSGAFLEDRDEWLVVGVIRTRDSQIIEASNFESAWSAIEDASVLDNELSCESHRFGHWGPGWFEIILVRPGSHCARVAEEIERKLDDYPILDDDDVSARESELVFETWTNLSVRDRVHECQRAGISIFAARHDDLPQDDNGRLWESLSREC